MILIEDFYCVQTETFGDGSEIKNGKFRKIFKDGAAINID